MAKPGTPFFRRHRYSRSAWIALLLLASWASTPACAQSTPSDPADARGDEVARIVTGIVSFTHWPAEKPALRLCIVTPALHAGSLVQHMAANTARPAIVQSYPAADTHLESDCDVVYIEPVQDAVRDGLFQRLAGRPILSVGGDDDACSIGSLFCLTRATGAVSFAANLDMIARSGLRINPKVLLLARKEAAR